jgi:hypothetical protein
VYVADSYNHRIQKFDSEGNYVTEWGSLGSNPGQFRYPFNLAVDDADRVYVADTYNHRIQKFDSEGNYLTRWGSRGDEIGEFEAPCDIAIDGEGHVYVADTFNHRVQKFGQPYDFDGFYSPIINPPDFNPATPGRAVPIKFSLGADQGPDIFAAGYPQSQPIDCDEPQSTVGPAIDISGDLSRVGGSGGQYHYNWNTKNAKEALAGTCQRLVVRLDDGTDHFAYFDFR